MRYIQLSCLLLLMNCHLLYSEKNEVIVHIRDQISRNINLIKNNENIDLLSQKNDLTERLSSNKLQNIYFFDINKILYKRKNENQAILNHQILHYHFNQLARLFENNLYLSNLFTINGRAYYMIGQNLTDHYLLYLFEIKPVPTHPPHAIIDQEGTIILNHQIETTGLDKVRARIKDEQFEKRTVDNYTILKFDFFKISDDYFFIF